MDLHDCLVAATILLGGTTLLLPGDNTTIPPAPADVHAMLISKQPLARAIDAAEKDTAGLASEASFGANGVVTVHTYTPGEHFVVQVDGASATVKSREKRGRFPGAPVEGNWTELPSGLKYYDLVVGTGAQPAGPTTTVKVHYTGWLLDGTKFDSSVDRGQPIDFALNGFMKGLTEGVGSMKVGGKRKLIIPQELGYGPRGRDPVPPRATLVYDVELLDIVK